MTNLSEQQQALLMKGLDGELSGEQEQEFHELLQHHEEVRKEWEAMKKLKEMTGTMKFNEPPEETWDRYWAGVYARMERGLAWLLVSIGAALVLTIAGYEAIGRMLSDTALSLPAKLGMIALLLGTAILVVSVAREKWVTRKSDKYREVIR